MVSSLPQTVPMRGSRVPRVHQRLDKIRQQQNIRIQRQAPNPNRRARNGLILSGRKTDILVVINNPDPILEWL